MAASDRPRRRGRGKNKLVDKETADSGNRTCATCSNIHFINHSTTLSLHTFGLFKRGLRYSCSRHGSKEIGCSASVFSRGIAAWSIPPAAVAGREAAWPHRRLCAARPGSKGPRTDCTPPWGAHALQLPCVAQLFNAGEAGPLRELARVAGQYIFGTIFGIARAGARARFRSHPTVGASRTALCCPLRPKFECHPHPRPYLLPDDARPPCSGNL